MLTLNKFEETEKKTLARISDACKLLFFEGNRLEKRQAVLRALERGYLFADVDYQVMYQSFNSVEKNDVIEHICSYPVIGFLDDEIIIFQDYEFTELERFERDGLFIDDFQLLETLL